MRFLPAFVTLLFLPVVLLADDDPSDITGTTPASKIQDKGLEGKWENTSTRYAGKEVQLSAEKAVLTFRGDAVTLKMGEATHAGTFKVDKAKTPKTLDITPDDSPPLRVIYEVTGDELRICSREQGKDRPTEFAAKQGDGTSINTYKRLKK
jgi:uncharacterized protein (TIGR03067 family)